MDRMAHLQNHCQHKFQWSANQQCFHGKTHVSFIDSKDWPIIILKGNILVLGEEPSFNYLRILALQFFLPVLSPTNTFSCGLNVLDNLDINNKFFQFKVKSEKTSWAHFTRTLTAYTQLRTYCQSHCLASSKWADVCSIACSSRESPLKLDLFPSSIIFISLHDLSPAPISRHFDVTLQATNPSTWVQGNNYISCQIWEPANLSFVEISQESQKDIPQSEGSWGGFTPMHIIWYQQWLWWALRNGTALK